MPSILGTGAHHDYLGESRTKENPCLKYSIACPAGIDSLDFDVAVDQMLELVCAGGLHDIDQALLVAFLENERDPVATGFGNANPAADFDPLAVRFDQVG